MKSAAKKLYDQVSLLDAPIYPVVQAAHYLNVPYHTLYSWLRPVYFMGTQGSVKRPVIQRPGNSDKLSFLNLIEGHVVKALQQAHNVPLPEMRAAIDYCEHELGDVPRLLVSPQLRTAAGRLFLDRVSGLLNVGRSGQYGMKAIFGRYLERIIYDDDSPRQLYPFVLDRDTKIVSISPFVSFGRAVVSARAITTQVIAQRFNAGESKQSIANDYAIKESEVEEAIFYESAA